MTTPKAEAGDYVLVPREPTEAMIDASRSTCLGRGDFEIAWKLMLSASPPSPSVAAGRMRADPDKPMSEYSPQEALAALGPIFDEAVTLVNALNDDTKFPPSMAQESIEAYRDGAGWSTVLFLYHLWPKAKVALATLNTTPAPGEAELGKPWKGPLIADKRPQATFIYDSTEKMLGQFIDYEDAAAFVTLANDYERLREELAASSRAVFVEPPRPTTMGEGK